MTSEEVSRYLHDHPEFFDQYADLLALVTIPDPHTGRAISITEKQLFNLREKVRTLEAKMSELIGFGEENDVISEKVHALGLALIAAHDFDGVTRAIHSHLGGTFGVPHVALRLWGADGGDSAEFVPVSESVKLLTASLAVPECGPAEGQPALELFGPEAGGLRSMAQISLRGAHGTCFGLLAMASEDATRFYPELGTLYLERIGEMVTAALTRVGA